MSDPKFYVVWQGRTTGIFSSWAECEAQVKGFAGAQFKSFPSRTTAVQALADGYDHHVVKAAKPAATRAPAPGKPRGHGGPIPDSYCVDAACSGNPGPVEYQCVHTSTRKNIFKMGPLPGGSCNIGEFLALVHALALFTKKGIDLPVYSDSMNGISWVKQKKCKTCVERTDDNAPLFDLIDRAEQWLATHEYENRILKWDTRNWGEIPADYGRK